MRVAFILDLALKNYYGNRNNDFWNNKLLWPGLETTRTIIIITVYLQHPLASICYDSK